MRTTILLLLVSAAAWAQPASFGQGWLGEFDHAAGQLQSLAEAIPAQQYGWRPGAGVRSVSEVLMHVAVGNYWLLAQAGGKIPGNTPPIAPDLEKKTTKKDDVLRWLGNSFAAVRAAYPQADKAKAVKFAGRASTAEAVFLRLLVHNHEHMGQMIAYTRSMGIKPPWSKD